MTWVKFDDGVVDNVKTLKVWARDPEAFALDVRAIAYCCKHLTDGFVDEAVVASWYPDPARKQVLQNILLEVGRWEAVEGGFSIHDFLDYNKSKAEVEAERRKKAEAGKLGGKRSGEARRSKGEAGA
jgi:hypothetical protein